MYTLAVNMSRNPSITIRCTGRSVFNFGGQTFYIQSADKSEITGQTFNVSDKLTVSLSDNPLHYEAIASRCKALNGTLQLVTVW